jgi:uncharacterized protein YdhG (YjbR/CyaY superfamily)
MVTKTANRVEEYLTGLEEPKQSTLRQLRSSILEIIPDAEECISYGLPAYRVRGKVIAGFAAFKKHLSYLPHSGSVIPEVGARAAGYTTMKGSLHFAVDKPLPKLLVRQLVKVRLHQAFPDEGRSN